MSRTISVRCPICEENVSITVDESKILNASEFPVAITHVHGSPPHSIIVYIDAHFRVRGIEQAPVAIKAPVEVKTEIIPIPHEKEVSLDGLSKDEKLILLMCDGKTTVAEIAKKLNKEYGYVKIICKKLHKIGKLKELKKRIVRGD